MKKSILLAFFACFSACVARAELVTHAMAMAAADVWAERNAQFGTGNNATNVITECDPDDSSIVLWHQVSMADGGCLIIAPVTEIEPVVMALERDPGELPAAHPLRGILTLDMRKRLRFLNLYGTPASGGRQRLTASASGAQTQEPADEAAANREAVRREWAAQQQTKWNGLLAGSGGNGGGRGRRLAVGLKQKATDKNMKEMVIVPGFEAGGPLTHWNQSEAEKGGICYNYYTPGNVVCGCVATAAAAMMQFFRVGEKAGQEIKAGQADAGTTYKGASYPTSTKGGKYDWSSLPKNYGGDQPAGDLTEANRQLLGRVTFDAGVAVGMSWNDGGSGASEAATATAFTKYFKFHEVRSVGSPDPNQYEKLIYAQCRAGAPVGMGIGRSAGGSGHSVVAVGYGVDEDDVERVRVFLGWGGSGDGWYALPYINTKATYTGSEDLYDLIHDIITMIGYDDDKVVPVCGRFLPYINPPVSIGGVEYSEADPNFGNIFTNGYFGARVSASETMNKQVEVVCHIGGGKSGKVSIGADPGKDSSNHSDGGGLCNWIPDPFLFPLLNSEVALSFTDAREKSIASITNGTPKPVLAFSGKWGEAPTDAAWNYLYWFDSEADDATKESFTNKYVVLCTPYSLGNLSESDGNPSIGIFDGRAISADANKVWSFHNGRLALWSIGGSIYTNVESQVENDIREFYVTNGVDGAGCIVTNTVEEVLERDPDAEFALNGRVPARYITGWGITNKVEYVMEEGRANFLVRATGASVTVSNDCSAALAGWLDPVPGTYTMSNGVVFTSIASQFVTNADENVEFTCLGCIYSWTNMTEGATGVDVAGIVTNEFAAVRSGMVVSTATNHAYTITWLWEPSKVKITTETEIDDFYKEDRGRIDPGTGWYPISTRLTFNAVPPVSSPGEEWYFYNWKPDPGTAYLSDADKYSEFGGELTLVVERPVTIRAVFKCETQLPLDWGSFNLVVTSACMSVSSVSASDTEEDKMNKLVADMEGILGGSAVWGGDIVAPGAPLTRLNSVALENNATNLIQKFGIGPMKLDASTTTGTNGESYVCCGWKVSRYTMNEREEVLEEIIDLAYVASGYAAAVDDPTSSKPNLELNNALLPTVAGVRTGDEHYQFKSRPKVADGETLTLTWLWRPRTASDASGDGVSRFYDIQWNDSLDNLKHDPDHPFELMTVAQMDANGWTTADIVVTTPPGWSNIVSAVGGKVVATLIRVEAALQAAVDPCNLTVYPNGDGTYTVKATIADGLRGFWYVLYGSDDLTTWEAVTSGTYESGTPSAQAQGTAADPHDSVTLSITVTPGDTAAGAKRFYKVVSGATATPLTTY